MTNSAHALAGTYFGTYKDPHCSVDAFINDTQINCFRT